MSSSTPLVGMSSTKKGVLHIHLIQARHLIRCVSGVNEATSSTTSMSGQGYNISLQLGPLSHAPPPSTNSSSPLSHSLIAPVEGEVVWNHELEVPLTNVDHWLWIHATPIVEGEEETNKKRRFSSSKHGKSSGTCQPGEIRIPLKEYESGVFQDCWMTFRPPTTSNTNATITADSSSTIASSSSYVSGQIHLRFMYQLSHQADQCTLSQLPPSLGAFTHHLLQTSGWWLRVCLLFLDSRNESSASGDNNIKSHEMLTTLQAILTLLSHTRFSLMLNIIESMVKKELGFLAEQQSGRIDSVWASNLFRRNSVAAKLLTMYCLSTQPNSHHSSSSMSSVCPAREGVGKQYLLQLLTPFVEQVIKDVNGSGSSTPTSGGGVTHPNHFGIDTNNPYEIDPSKLGGNQPILERNQTLLIERCQTLLDSVLASNQRRPDDGSAPITSSLSVPPSMKWLARSLKRCVCDYVTHSSAAALNSRGSMDASSAELLPPPHFSPSRVPDVSQISETSSNTNTTSLTPIGLLNRAQIAHESSHNSLASLFFLRFLCPALVTPVHYGVVQRPPPPAASRALILLAKALQSLVNSAGSVTSAAAARNSSLAEEDLHLLHRTPTKPKAILSSVGASSAPNSISILSTSPDIFRSPTTDLEDTHHADHHRQQRHLHSVATSTAAARLFKESYMEIFYPFINSNLSRVSTFLDDLATVDSISSEILPGVEELHGSIESQQKELEASIWVLHTFFKTNFTPISAFAQKLIIGGTLSVPTTNVGQSFSGLGAMLELTRPHHSELGRSDSPSSTSHHTNDDARTAAFQTIVTRFRNQIESMAPLPPLSHLHHSHHHHGHGRPHHSPTSSTSSGESPPSTSPSTSPPSNPPSALAAAASSGLKFIQRFLPSSKQDKEKEKDKVPPCHPPTVSTDSTPSSSTHSSTNMSSSTSSTPSLAPEEFQFFKQASVEIQLRLSTQLEESEERCAALQRAYAQLEQESLMKDRRIHELQQQLAHANMSHNAARTRTITQANLLSTSNSSADPTASPLTSIDESNTN